MREGVYIRRPTWNENFNIEAVSEIAIGFANANMFIWSGFEETKLCCEKSTSRDIVRVEDNVAVTEEFVSCERCTITDKRGCQLSARIYHPASLFDPRHRMRWIILADATYQHGDVKLTLSINQPRTAVSDEDAGNYLAWLFYYLIYHADNLAKRGWKLNGIATVDTKGTLIARVGNLLIYKEPDRDSDYQIYRRIHKEPLVVLGTQ